MEILPKSKTIKNEKYVFLVILNTVATVSFMPTFNFKQS